MFWCTARLLKYGENRAHRLIYRGERRRKTRVHNSRVICMYADAWLLFCLRGYFHRMIIPYGFDGWRVSMLGDFITVMHSSTAPLAALCCMRFASVFFVAIVPPLPSPSHSVVAYDIVPPLLPQPNDTAEMTVNKAENSTLKIPETLNMPSSHCSC